VAARGKALSEIHHAPLRAASGQAISKKGEVFMICRHVKADSQNKKTD